MLKYFGISFRDSKTHNNKEDNLKALLVGINLNSKLKSLKYIRNGRINFEFTDCYIDKGHVYNYEDSNNHIYKNDTLYSGFNDTVSNIYVPFLKNNIEDLFNSSNCLKELLALCIYQLKEYWKIMGWNENDLDRIQKEILEEDFSLSVELLKSSSDNKNYKVEVNSDYFKEYCNLNIELYKKRALVDSQLLFKAQIHTPFMFSLYKSALGSINWIEEDEFEIKSLLVGLVYRIKVVNDKMKFIITPENNQYEPVKFLVDSLRYGKTSEESVELYKKAMRGY